MRSGGPADPVDLTARQEGPGPAEAGPGAVGGRPGQPLDVDADGVIGGRGRHHPVRVRQADPAPRARDPRPAVRARTERAPLVQHDVPERAAGPPCDAHPGQDVRGQEVRPGPPRARGGEAPSLGVGQDRRVRTGQGQEPVRLRDGDGQDRRHRLLTSCAGCRRHRRATARRPPPRATAVSRRGSARPGSPRSAGTGR